MSGTPLRITVWNEFIHERENETVRAIYPDGIHGAIAAGLQTQLGSAAVVRSATMDQPEHGLTDEVLAATDVLTWWGHAAHKLVDDRIVERVQLRVLEGMGLLVLHSAHASKIFKRLLGTTCMLRWREAGEKERLWITDPSHPIVDGIAGEYIELPQTEMYGEFFDIPQPESLLMISWFEGGEVFRSACTFRRGKGKIFYFRPGHETFPIYYDANVQRILANAARWAAPSGAAYHGKARNVTEPLEPIASGHVADASLHVKKG